MQTLVFRPPLLLTQATSDLEEEHENEVVCQALDKLIDECTLILGWCFPTEQVQETKSQQRQVSTSALAKMSIFCPEEGEEDQAISIQPPEDIFAETFDLDGHPLISAQNSSASLIFLPWMLAISICSFFF